MCNKKKKNDICEYKRLGENCKIVKCVQSSFEFHSVGLIVGEPWNLTTMAGKNRGLRY